MLNLIGLHGDTGTGKDETAKILKDYGFEQRAQAEAIREILLGLNPLIRINNGKVYSLFHLYSVCDQNWDKVKAEASESIDLMIRLGQTCRNVLGIDIWLNTALPSQKALDMGRSFVISDVRQVNEFEAIKTRGGQVWKITRPSTAEGGVRGAERRDMDGLLDHLSFDHTIKNDGTLSELRIKVDHILAQERKNTKWNFGEH